MESPDRNFQHRLVPRAVGLLFLGVAKEANDTPLRASAREVPGVDHRSTPAQWALGDRPEVARLLVDRGARTDLFMAAVFDDLAMAQTLPEQDPTAISVRVGPGKSHEHLGFDDKYRWSLGFAETRLEVARRRGSTSVYAYVLERSPAHAQLIQASRRGDLDAIERLLEADATLLGGLDDGARGVGLAAGHELTPRPRDRTESPQGAQACSMMGTLG